VTLRTRLATPADRARWDAFADARPEADVLQAWAWGEAGAGEPGERWRRVVAVDGADRVRGVAQVLSRATSFGRRVLYVPHGPVWEREAADAAAVLRALLDGVREVARAERGVVVKLDPRALPRPTGVVGPGAQPDPADDTSRVADALVAHGLRRARHDLQAPTTRLVALASDPDAMAAAWTADGRAEVRRSRREGVTTSVSRTHEPDALDAFAALLAETASRGGFRARSRAFLGALADELARDGGWYLAQAAFEGRVIAGAVAPRTGDRAFYLYAASTRDPDLARKRGPYAVMAALMAALAADGVRSLDLWGVREPDDPAVGPEWEGFSLFKRRFGGTALRHPGTFDLVVDPLWDRLRELRERLRDRRA
jgi:peptidoglycan pentaglycine glycine transferase (the first glycine)